MELYLDANATTTVLPQARAAALASMDEAFGNPSSVHGPGRRARARLDAARACARRVLGAAQGRLLFTSGATEGLHTAVLSVLQALQATRRAASVAGDRGAGVTAPPPLLLYGATEHKAVPEALRHWNELLGLGAQLQAIPVDREGRHDLDWLRRHAPQAALVCTMAVNNETGVISDLDGIGAALQGSGAHWLVDGVQALGKLPLQLNQPCGGRLIDYACFSGHKLHAPKGIGLLYAREGAPFTALTTGGGQEQGQRAGTENMPGIAALGAVLAALEAGGTFHDSATLAALHGRLATALQRALPGLVFNAPPALCVPTTLNVSLPGRSAQQLMALLEDAGLAASGGSACSAGREAPSDVLLAMGLPAWQCTGAVRLSFGAADEPALIDAACARLQAAAARWQAAANGTGAAAGTAGAGAGYPVPPARLTRFLDVDDCCYVLADPACGQAVLIDPRPALVPTLLDWLGRHRLAVQALLCSSADVGTARAAAQLQQALALQPDTLRWPALAAVLDTGAGRLKRCTRLGGGAYVLQHDSGLPMVFAGSDAMPEQPGAVAPLLSTAPLPPDALLLPGRDPARQWAWRPNGASRGRAACSPPVLEIDAADLHTLAQPLLIDVREADEAAQQRWPTGLPAAQLVPLAGLLDAVPAWLAQPVPMVFVCRSGQRSAQAAQLLCRLGHGQAWSLAGGLQPLLAATAASA